MAQNRNERRSFIGAIKRWFGNKAEDMNDAMDNAVTTEEQIERKIKELRRQYDAIINDPQLAELAGAAEIAKKKLADTRKRLTNGNYDYKIKALKARNDMDNALKVLKEKKEVEEEIERLKEEYSNYKDMSNRMKENLDLLDTQIKDSTRELEKLKQTNANARKTEEMYSLMNRINDITSANTGASEIAAQIESQERRAAGTRAEFERRNASGAVDRQLRDQALLDELNNY